jgi:hypothetical protein
VRGFLALNAAGIVLGLGAFGMGALAMFLDQSLVRIPLLLVATAGASVVLYTVLRKDPESAGAPRSELAHQPTAHERRRNRMGLISASSALFIVIAEVVAHEIMH